LLILNPIFGAKTDFKKVFATVCYANLITVLAAVMSVANILFGDPERFDAQNPVPSNLGFFLNPLEASKPVRALATSIDIFTIWFLILLSIGLSEACNGKVKSRSILMVFGGLWVIWILGKVGWAMVTS
jgi:hypothetical protein